MLAKIQVKLAKQLVYYELKKSIIRDNENILRAFQECDRTRPSATSPHTVKGHFRPSSSNTIQVTKV